MIILGTNSIKETGYDVANSCRFNSADSAKMAITFSGAGTSLRKATFSFWIKRSNISIDEELLYRISSGSDYFNIAFSDTDTLKIKQSISSSVNLEFISNAVYRDVSAWMHLLVVFDTTQSTESNRVKIYVNGTQVTSWSTSTYPGQNTDMLFGAANANTIASSGGGNYFGGYLCEVCYCDGQSLTPSDFGEFDEDSPTIWKPKDPSGLTFGTNGFYLDFEDSSNLGNDANGGTDLTETNLAATDQMIDTCTKNFPTLNPLESSAVRGSNTYSQGNLQVQTPTSSTGNTFSTIGVSSGKWYAEFYIKAYTSLPRWTVGVTGDLVGTLSNSNNIGGLSGARDAAYMGNDGDKFVSNSESSYGSAFSAGDIIGVVLDVDNDTVNFYHNNVARGNITIASTGTWHMGCGDVSGGARGTFVANFGQDSSFAGNITAANNTDEHGEGLFKYSPPSGFITLNTTNLAEYG